MALAFGAPAQAVEFSFLAPGAKGALWEAIATASLTRESTIADDADAQSIFAAARADYARILAAFYEFGYYAPEINIKINGVEAAMIAPLDVPQRLETVTVRIKIGPQFTFSQAQIGPLAAKTALPEGYRTGAVARVGTIKEAARASVQAWREAGHAKARVAEQRLSADHRSATMAAQLGVNPGPQARFGTLEASGAQRLRQARLMKIAGYPTGRLYSPEQFEAVAARLRRTGIFSSVALTEAETLDANNALNAKLQVVEAPLRRIGGGAEVATLDGGTISGYWLHRNLNGGGEKLRLDAELRGIESAQSGVDYELGARIDRPASFSPDTSAYLEARLEKEDEAEYRSEKAKVEFGASHVLNRRATGDLGIGYRWSEYETATQRQIFRHIALPAKFTYDSRKDPLNPTGGQYLLLSATPFLGFGTTGKGAQLTTDMRLYKALDGEERVVLAGRMQFGMVTGAGLAATPSEYLFYSGGGGTVRGQPYQSLSAGERGGTGFVGLSGELRMPLRKALGAALFYDAGMIGAEGFAETDWHSGAGFGLRYATSIGPIRFDIAKPMQGSTGDGPQIYLGIGQAF